MTEPTDRDLAELAGELDDITPTDPTLIGAGYSRTDWGNAQRLALYKGAELRYVHETETWYRWRGTRWTATTPGELIASMIDVAVRIAEETRHVGEARRAHADFANSSLSSKNVNSALAVARGNPDLWTDHARFDADPELLNVNNCTLSLRTGEWHRHRSEDLNTRVCPTDWDPAATSSLLDSFLHRFLPDPAERDYVLASLAVAALECGNRSRRLILMIGPTSTGKSTLADLINRTLGQDYVATGNVSVFRSNFDDRPRPDLLRAKDARLLLAYEASDVWELHADQVKRMTGGDPLVARAMRSDVMVEQVPNYTPVIIANDVPRIKSADDAVRARLRVMLMDAAQAEFDDGRARERLVSDEQARRALLALLVRTYREREGVPPPDGEMPLRFAEVTQAVFAQLDDVDAVLTTLLEDGTLHPYVGPPAGCVRVSTLHRCYVTHVRKHGTDHDRREVLGPRQFARRLLSLGYEVVRSDGSRVLGLTLGTSLTALTAQN